MYLLRTSSASSPHFVRSTKICIFADVKLFLLTRWHPPAQNLIIMAKGNMLLGQARGKVGSVVFSRAFGKQITRSLAENVKNPRSDGQNVQRAIFATVNSFASALRSTVDHSFQSVKEGQESVNRFVSINIKRLREAYLAGSQVDIMPKGAALPYANNYRISQGTLGLQRCYIASNRFVVADGLEERNIINSNTLKSIIPAFAPGCEFAVIKVFYNEAEHYHYITRERAVFKSDFAGVDDTVIIDVSGINKNFLVLSKTTDAALIKGVDLGDGNNGLAISDELTSMESATVHLVACCFIVSQKDSNGKWMYTTSDLICAEGWNTPHDLTAAIASYGNNAATESTSAEYLQQSSTEGEAVVTAMQSIPYNVKLSGEGVAYDSQQLQEFMGSDTMEVECTMAKGRGAEFVVNFPKNGNKISAGQVTTAYFRGATRADGLMEVTKSTTGNTVVVSGTINTPNNLSDLSDSHAEIVIANDNGQGVNLYLQFIAPTNP